MALKRWTKEEFVEKAIGVFSDKFTYEKVNYVNAKLPITVTCKEHGDFNTTAYSFLRSKQACPRCYYKLIGESRIKNHQAIFIERSKKKFKDVFEYSRVEYKGKDEDVTITCKLHGDFTVNPLNHLATDNGGCRNCVSDSFSRSRKLSTEEFIERARKVHGDKYGYSKTGYKTTKSNVLITCSLHGDFRQRASKHLEGADCPKCMNRGFQASKPAILYVISSGDLTKVGISNKLDGKRVKSISRSSGHSFEIDRVYNFSSGIACSDVETDLLRYLRTLYSNPERSFDGYTETFLNVNKNDLYSKIEELRELYG